MNLLTRSELLNFWEGERGVLDFLLARLDRHLHSVSYFPIHLNHDFDFVFDQESFVETRPWLFRDLTRQLQLFPELGTQVGREWIEQEQNRLHRRDRYSLGGGKRVHENHHLRYSCVK